VIVLDVNLLIYAYDTTTLHHRRARRWLEAVFSGTEPVGLPWQTVCAFLRVSTNSRLPGNRFTMDEAVAVVERCAALPTVHFLAPGIRHWAYFRRMLIDGDVTGPLATDAQLAALTIENGGVLYTTDRDFARFPGLKWVNPLVAA
jgi:uncharacterized protein